MKKKSVMMNGANFAPSCPMLAMAISFRTKSTMASTAPGEPARRLARPAAAARAPRGDPHGEEHQRRGDDHEHHVLGGRQVDASDPPMWMSGQRGR